MNQSGKAATTHFLHQRVSAALLVPLAIWFLWAALSMVGAEHRVVLAFLARPLNAALTILFVLAAAYHMALGVRVVIEDYVHGGAGPALLVLNKLFALTMALACTLAVLFIAW